MLTEIRVRNPRRIVDAQLNLPLQGPSKFPIVFVDGLTPVAAEFTSSPYANLPGEYLQSSRVGVRNIVLTLELKPDWSAGEDPEDLRKILSGFFTPGHTVEFELVTDKATRHISGVVETFEAPMFVREPQVQISILCHDPYFYESSGSGETTVVNTVGDGSMMEFWNTGDVDAGVRIGITPDYYRYSIAVHVGPVYLGMNTHPTFEVDTPVAQTQELVIDGRPFHKDVRNATTGRQYLGNIVGGSVWPVFQPVNMAVIVTGESTNSNPTYTVSVTYSRRYASL